MRTINSLEAQTHFEALLDTSQHEAVIITRQGQPYSAVISNMGNPKDALAEFLIAMSQLSPLRGEEAKAAARQVWNAIGDQAEKDGLTEADITRLVHAARQ